MGEVRIGSGYLCDVGDHIKFVKPLYIGGRLLADVPIQLGQP